MDPAQALGLGRICERAGWCDVTVNCYRRAAGADGSPPTRAEALRRLALHHHRQRNYGEAAGVWQQMFDMSELSERLRQEASVALAVHHEHRSGDLWVAQRFADRALVAARHHPRRRAAVERRLRRLGRKISERQGMGHGRSGLLAPWIGEATTRTIETKTSCDAPPLAASAWRR